MTEDIGEGGRGKCGLSTTQLSPTDSPYTGHAHCYIVLRNNGGVIKGKGFLGMKNG